MTATSLLGFGAVFVLVAVATSALAGGLLLHGRAQLARRGSAVERRAAELAAVVPLVIGGAVVAILVLVSVLGPDHCVAHDHHAHLCLWHGAAWARHPLVLVALATAAATILARAALLAGALLRGAAVVRSLRGVTRREDGVEIVESARVFCFAAGLRRGTIIASSAARGLLSDAEWRAMLAHEAGHIGRRDLARRLSLDLALLVAAPLVAIAVRDLWDDATERLRDADAADTVGSPDVVASALVRMAGANAALDVDGVAAFTKRDRQLADRVAALLDEWPRGEPAARRLARSLAAACVTLVGAATVFAQPLHHLLETLLG